VVGDRVLGTGDWGSGIGDRGLSIGLGVICACTRQSQDVAKNISHFDLIPVHKKKGRKCRYMYSSRIRIIGTCTHVCRDKNQLMRFAVVVC